MSLLPQQLREQVYTSTVPNSTPSRKDFTPEFSFVACRGMQSLLLRMNTICGMSWHSYIRSEPQTGHVSTSICGSSHLIRLALPFQLYLHNRGLHIKMGERGRRERGLTCREHNGSLLGWSHSALGHPVFKENAWEWILLTGIQVIADT